MASLDAHVSSHVLQHTLGFLSWSASLTNADVLRIALWFFVEIR